MVKRTEVRVPISSHRLAAPKSDEDGYFGVWLGEGTRCFFSLITGSGRSNVKAMKNQEWLQNILQNIEPIPDSIYGPRYRCALTLKDGTHIPCAILHSKSKLIELAKRRLKEEMSGKGRIGGLDPYDQVLSSFVAGGNKVNDYDVVSAALSRYAPPLSLLNQVHGETTMGWTGWVFEMKDGKLFSYGSSFLMEFFNLSEGYSFDDVAKVHNHSFLSTDGALINLQRGGMLPDGYSRVNIFRERVFFICYIDGI